MNQSPNPLPEVPFMYRTRWHKCYCMLDGYAVRGPVVNITEHRTEYNPGEALREMVEKVHAAVGKPA